VIEYNEVNTNGNQHKFLIQNYHVPSVKAVYFDSVIIVNFHQHSYKVEFEVHNTKFTFFLHTARLFKGIQMANRFGNSIHFYQCVVEKFNFIYCQAVCSILIHLTIVKKIVIKLNLLVVNLDITSFLVAHYSR